MVRSLVQRFKLRSGSFCFPSTPSSNFGSGTAWKMSSRGPEKCSRRHWEQGFAWHLADSNNFEHLQCDTVCTNKILTSCAYPCSMVAPERILVLSFSWLAMFPAQAACMMQPVVQNKMDGGSIGGTRMCSIPQRKHTESKQCLHSAETSELGQTNGWCLKTTLEESKLRSNPTDTFLSHPATL